MLSALVAVWFGILNSAREISKEEEIFRRERLANLKVGPYVASKMFVLAVLCLVQSAMLLLVLAIKVDFSAEVVQFTANGPVYHMRGEFLAPLGFLSALGGTLLLSLADEPTMERAIDVMLIGRFESPGDDRGLERLLAAPAMHIPDEEVAEFATEVVPSLPAALPVLIDDDAMVKPEILGPFPLLRVDLSDQGARVQWSAAYDINGRLKPVDGATASLAYRDRAAETAALAGVRDGATVLIGGFGTAGIPGELIDALIHHGARDLTVVNNNAGNADQGLAALLKAGQVRKIICSFPRQVDSYVFDELYRSGKLELELVPQGNLAERLRAAGAGIGAFFCPTAYGTELAAGKETREINGKHYVLEYPIHGDVALIKAEKGDRWGNLAYRMSARNFGPVMAMAARKTVATVHEVVELGALDPEHIVTPGIFVHQIVKIDRVATQAGGFKKAA